jgi:hypothetical protein
MAEIEHLGNKELKTLPKNWEKIFWDQNYMPQI